MYTDGEHWSNLVRRVPICPSTNIFQVFPISFKSKFFVHELSKSFHSVRAATNTDKLEIECKIICTILAKAGIKTQSALLMLHSIALVESYTQREQKWK